MKNRLRKAKEISSVTRVSSDLTAKLCDQKYRKLNMKDTPPNRDQSRLTRRQLLGLATLTTAGLAAASVGVPEAKAVPKAGEEHEPLEDFKHDVEGGEGWVGEGGSEKESTVKQLPIATSIAGVSMRLKPGGLRELHWHAIAAEWAFVVKGNVRATVISPNGEGAQDDFGPGDVWYFPKGHGHALQALGPDEAHFILGFDDGHFSEFGTFSITDWVCHTPPNVLSRNLGLPESVLTKFPKSEAYILPAPLPPAIHQPFLQANSQTNQSPHTYRLGAPLPIQFPGADLRIESQNDCPIQKTLTGATMLLKPGALREMH